MSRHDERFKRPDANSREDRQTVDRTDLQHPDRVIDGLDLASVSWDQAVLPTPPVIPGFHTIYLSTTNTQDTIPFRMRLGYTPVQMEDLDEQSKKEWASLVTKTGEYQGMLAVNEMLLFKLPEERYQAYMRQLHHTKPLQEEQALKARFDQMQDGMNTGYELVREVGDGVTGLTQNRNPPRFQ